jgi:hypothetical protein
LDRLKALAAGIANQGGEVLVCTHRREKARRCMRPRQVGM